MANPHPLAVVACDAIHQDPWTSKKTILGVFSATFVLEFPANIRLVVYAAFSGEQGVMPVLVEVVDSDDLGTLSSQRLILISASTLSLPAKWS